MNSILYIRTREEKYKSDFLFVFFLIIGTIPAAVLGVLLSDFIADSVGMTTIAIMLFVTGIALWVVRNLKDYKGESDLTIKDAFLVGLGQASRNNSWDQSFRCDDYFSSYCWNGT